MRDYLFWAIRDWLDPKHETGAALPPNDTLTAELTEFKWQFLSNGRIKIEDKERVTGYG